MTKTTQLSVFLVSSLLLLIGLTNCVPQQDVNPNGGAKALSISKDEVTFANTGGQEKVGIETGGAAWDFFANTTEDWLKVSKEGDDVVIAVSENKSADDRTATLVISSSGMNRSINIRQSSADVVFSLSDNNELMLPAQGGLKVIAVESNSSSWQLQPLSDEVNWLALRGGNGQSDMLIVEAQPNPSFEVRTAEVEVVLSNGTKKPIVIKQAGVAKYLLPYDQDWRVYSEYSLIKYEQERGSVMQMYSFPQEGDTFSDPTDGQVVFNTSSTVMPLLIYKTTLIDPKYNQAVFKLMYKDKENPVEIEEYAEFLKSNDYEELGTQQPEKKRNFMRKDEKAIAVIDFNPAYGEYALVGFVPVYPQEKEYPTFSVLPRGIKGKLYSTVFNKADKKLKDVESLEQSQGSVVKAKMMDEKDETIVSKILFEAKASDDPEEETLRLYSFYPDDPKKTTQPEYVGSVNEFILFFKDYTKAVYRKPKKAGWEVTDEFYSLLKKEGYQYVTTSGETQLYRRDSDGVAEILHITYEEDITDQLMGGNPHVQIGYFQRLLSELNSNSNLNPSRQSSYPEYQFRIGKSGEYQLTLSEGSSPMLRK